MTMSFTATKMYSIGVRIVTGTILKTLRILLLLLKQKSTANEIVKCRVLEQNRYQRYFKTSWVSKSQLALRMYRELLPILQYSGSEKSLHHSLNQLPMKIFMVSRKLYLTTFHLYDLKYFQKYRYCLEICSS